MIHKICGVVGRLAHQLTNLLASLQWYHKRGHCCKFS